MLKISNFYNNLILDILWEYEFQFKIKSDSVTVRLYIPCAYTNMNVLFYIHEFHIMYTKDIYRPQLVFCSYMP